MTSLYCFLRHTVDYARFFILCNRVSSILFHLLQDDPTPIAVDPVALRLFQGIFRKCRQEVLLCLDVGEFGDVEISEQVVGWRAEKQLRVCHIGWQSLPLPALVSLFPETVLNMTGPVDGLELHGSLKALAVIHIRQLLCSTRKSLPGSHPVCQLRHPAWTGTPAASCLGRSPGFP